MANTRVTEILSAKEARKRQTTLQSYWSKESQLSQAVLIRCCELLEEIARAVAKKKRQPSAYQSFISRTMKAKGISFTEAAKLWTARKSPKAKAA